jgi:hypothetical protein
MHIDEFITGKLLMDTYIITILHGVGQSYPPWVGGKPDARFEHLKASFNTAFYEDIRDWEDLRGDKPIRPLEYMIFPVDELLNIPMNPLIKHVEPTFFYRMNDYPVVDDKYGYAIKVTMEHTASHDYIKWRTRNGFGLYIYKMGHTNLFEAELKVCSLKD